MTKYFVSPSGNDRNPGTSRQDSLKNIYTAFSKLKSGDEIEIGGGDYYEQNTCVIEGKEDFKIYSAAGELARIRFSDKAWNGFDIKRCHHFYIGLIELTGNASKLNYEGAYEARDRHENKYNMNPIHIAECYRFLVQNVTMQDFPGGGGATDSDYAHFDRCIVRDNTKYGRYGCQALSFLGGMNSPGCVADEVRLKITNCTVYNNYNLIPWNKIKEINEGNGLYSDTTKESTKGVPYTGRVLFENNVSVFNGAAGIHLLNSCPVEIRNNYIAMNSCNLQRGEIQSTGVPDLKIVSNHIGTDADRECFCIYEVPHLNITKNTFRGTKKMSHFKCPDLNSKIKSGEFADDNKFD